MNLMKFRGQGAIEYLLLIGGVILVVAIVLGTLQFFGQAGSQKIGSTYTNFSNMTNGTANVEGIKCGNGRCEVGESAVPNTGGYCPNDCKTLNVCGNGSCDSGESIYDCPGDCGGITCTANCTVENSTKCSNTQIQTCSQVTIANQTCLQWSAPTACPSDQTCSGSEPNAQCIASGVNYTISFTINPSGAGTASANPNPVTTSGGTSTLSHTQNLGFAFSSWTAGTGCTISGDTATASNNCTITANYSGSASLCGNGTIDSGEQCDGTNLGNPTASCASLGLYSGTLACNSSTCMFDTSQCKVKWAALTSVLTQPFLSEFNGNLYEASIGYSEIDKFNNSTSFDYFLFGGSGVKGSTFYALDNLSGLKEMLAGQLTTGSNSNPLDVKNFRASTDTSIGIHSTIPPMIARVWALEFFNGKLYAGIDNGRAKVYNKSTSTWSNSLDTGSLVSNFEALKSFNGKLYAAQVDHSTGVNSKIYSFNGTTWTDTSLPVTQFTSAVFDVFENKLWLAVSASGWAAAKIYNFDTATSSWSLHSQISQHIVHDLESYNGKLYAATGSVTGVAPTYGKVFELTGTTWNAMPDSPGKSDQSQDEVYSLEIFNGKLFAATELGSVTYYKILNPLNVTLTVSAGANGIVSSSGGSYVQDSRQYVTATSNTGYDFDNWAINGTSDCIIANPYSKAATIRLGIQDCSITANFKPG